MSAGKVCALKCSKFALTAAIFLVAVIFLDIASCSWQDWSSWSSWSNCSAPCNGGNQSRSRNCTSNNVTHCSGISVQNRTCNTQYCEDRCHKARTADNEEKCCYFPNTIFNHSAVAYYNSCIIRDNCTFVCPLNKNGTIFGTCKNSTINYAWSPWTNCSDRCFTGKQSRSRNELKLIYTRNHTQEFYTANDTRYCNRHPCLENDTVYAKEVHSNNRTQCYFKEGTDRTCLFNQTDYKYYCFLDRYHLTSGICEPIHGSYSNWKEWSNCSENCFSGKRERKRLCDEPAPKNNGTCYGTDSEWELCNTHSCNNLTSKDCTRARNSTQEITCCFFNKTGSECVLDGTNNFTCPLDRFGYSYGICEPINGNVTEWSGWSNCSEACFTGSRYRTRNCTNPTPKYNGTCNDALRESEPCNKEPCYDRSRCTNSTLNHSDVHCCAFDVPILSSNPDKPAVNLSSCYHVGNDTWKCPLDRKNTTQGICLPTNKTTGEWEVDGVCKKIDTCLNQKEKYKRSCEDGLYGGPKCTAADKEEFRNCSIGNCTDTNWSRWAVWSACSTSCGTGKKTRTRYCLDNSNKQVADSKCKGKAVEEDNCSFRSCPGFVMGQPGQNCTAACQQKNLSCYWYNKGIADYSVEFFKLNFVCNAGESFQEWQHDWHPAYSVEKGACLGFKNVQYSVCGGHEKLNSTIRRLCHCTYPEDLVYGEWSAWSPCSKACGSAYKERRRSCKEEDTSRCQEDAMTQNTSCNLPMCPDDLGFTTWTTWSSCSKTCNFGFSDRSRACNDDKLCIGHTRESMICNTFPCKVNGGWGDWGQYSACSRSCGNGTRTRYRSCTNPTPLYGGSNCNDTQVGSHESRPCNTFHCSGVYISEGDTQCNGTCQRKKLTCYPFIETNNKTDMFKKLGLNCSDTSNAVWKNEYDPSYVHSDNKCQGYKQVPSKLSCKDASDIPAGVSRMCNCLNESDIGYNPWSNWGECSLTCGVGRKSRYRTCEKNCPGSNIDTTSCFTKHCPVNGGWSNFTDWSHCNVTCGGGVRYRYRYCTNPPRQHGGMNCDGKSFTSEGCNFQICPVHGMWGEWGKWSLCSKPCNNGTEEQTRYCDNPKPMYNGTYCIGKAKRSRICNSHPCKPVSLGVMIRFINESFTNDLQNQSKPRFQQLQRKISENVNSIYPKDNNHVLNVRVIFFRPGSVIANFTINYTEVTRLELVTLMTSLQENRRLGSMPLSNFSIKTDEIPKPPGSVNCTAMTESVILVELSDFSETIKSFNITGFGITYRKTRESDASAWHSLVVSSSTTQANLTRLSPFTLYTLRVTAITTDAVGIPSPLVDVSTMEGAPSSPPGNILCNVNSARSIYCSWTAVPYNAQNGIVTHYTVFHRLYNNPGNLIKSGKSWQAMTIPSTTMFADIKGLKPYTRYEVKISASTSAGEGPVAWKTLQTDEDVPSSPPLNVRGQSRISNKYVDFFWEEIPTNSWNGKPLSLKLVYSVTRKGSEAVVIGGKMEVSLGSDRRRYRVTGLEADWAVTMTIQGVTSAGDGVKSPETVAETCLCDQNFYAAWYVKSPYIFYEGKTVTGILPEFFPIMMSTICGTCGAYNSSVVHFDRTKNGQSSQSNSESDLKKQVSDNANFHGPISGKKYVTVFEGRYQYVNLIDGTMSAFVVVDPAKMSKSKEIIKSVFQCWPIFAVSFLMTVLAGILIWMADQFANPDEMPTGRFLSGTFQGFWWAFVSMTTVGYGDIAPRGSFARSIAITWTAIGLIVNGILVSSLSTALTVVAVSEQTLLYGANVSAVYKSPEYYLGVRRNGNMNSTGNVYNTSMQALNALVRREVQGTLLEYNEAANLQSIITSNGLKITKTFKSTSGIGFVLSGRTINFHTQIRSYVAVNYNLIQSLVKNFTKTVDIPVVTKNDGGVSGLFDEDSVEFKEVLQQLLVTFAIVVILGTTWNFVIRTYMLRRNRVNPTKSPDIIAKENYDKRSNEMFEIVDNLVSSLEKVEMLSEKQGIDRFRLLHKHFGTLPFGLPMWIKYGTTDDRYILGKIRVEEAFLENLNRKKKKKKKSSLRLVDVVGDEIAD